MQLFVGTYGFPVNAAGVTGGVRQVIRSDSGRPLRYVQGLDVTGTIFGSGQADLTDRENALRAALQKPYVDVVLKRDDGQPSALALLNSKTLSGVVVTSGPEFFEDQGSEYVTTRRFRFSVEATYLAPKAESALVSWTQTVSVLGNGGPIRTWRIPLNADPIRQAVTPRSTIRYTQSGQAVGHLRMPLPAPPMFGRAYLLNEQESVQQDYGRPLGRYWVEPSVRWNYVFEADKLLTGSTPLPVF